METKNKKITKKKIEEKKTPLKKRVSRPKKVAKATKGAKKISVDKKEIRRTVKKVTTRKTLGKKALVRTTIKPVKKAEKKSTKKIIRKKTSARKIKKKGTINDHLQKRLYIMIYTLSLFLFGFLLYQIAFLLVVFEEDDHQQAIQDITKRALTLHRLSDAGIASAQDGVDAMYDKKELLSYTRELEQLALESRNRQVSFTGDLSVMLLGRNMNVKEMHYRAENLHLYLERLARSVEFVALQSYTTIAQKELLQKNSDLLEEKVLNIQEAQ